MQVGSLDQIDHKPGGGDVIIPKNKTNWSHTKSKINSLDSLRLEKMLLKELELYDDYMAGRGRSNVEKRISKIYHRQSRWSRLG